jgi:hypothetical protein
MLRSLIGAVAICISLAPANAADPPNLPFGYTCEEVRAAIQQYGQSTALALAKLKGATPPQIAEARKCLK